MPNIDVG